MWSDSPFFPRSGDSLRSLNVDFSEKTPFAKDPFVWTQEPLNAPFLNGLFSSGFSRRKTAPYRTKSVKRPIKAGKRPINEGKRPIKAKVLVGVSVGSLMGCFRAPPTWRKAAPLKRPIKRSIMDPIDGFLFPVTGEIVL